MHVHSLQGQKKTKNRCWYSCAHKETLQKNKTQHCSSANTARKPRQAPSSSILTLHDPIFATLKPRKKTCRSNVNSTTEYLIIVSRLLGWRLLSWSAAFLLGLAVSRNVGFLGGSVFLELLDVLLNGRVESGLQLGPVAKHEQDLEPDKERCLEQSLD